jgi:Zn-dependent protease
LELFGTILVPAVLLLTASPFLFGWAKPVPVAFNRLSNPRRDMALVAFAGPAVNVLLATVSALLFHVLGWLPRDAVGWVGQTLYKSIVLNLLLAIFNLFPIPPLDGSRILLSVLPGPLARPYASLERFGFLILLGLVFLLPMIGRGVGVSLNVFSWLVGTPLARLLPTFEWIAGI